MSQSRQLYVKKPSRKLWAGYLFFHILMTSLSGGVLIRARGGNDRARQILTVTLADLGLWGNMLQVDEAIADFFLLPLSQRVQEA